MSKPQATKETPHEHDHTHSDHDHTSQPKLPIAPNSQVTVKLPWATVEPTYQKAVRKFAQTAKVDGFRKGKVPPAMAEQMIDQSALVEYVLQRLIPEAYAEEIKQAAKKPITQPELDPIKMDKGSDWEIIAYFAEVPEIQLGKYNDVVKKAGKKAQKEIQEQEAELVKKAAEQKRAKKPELESAAPATDALETAEKAAEPTPTTLSDAQKDELRTRHIFKHLVDAVRPEIAELLVRREADRELRRLLEQLQQLNISVESYLQSRKMTADQLRLEYLSAAVTSLQLEFILAEIGRQEKITVEDKEVDETLHRLFGEKLTEEQRTSADYRSYVFSTLVKQKIAKHLLSLI